MQIQFLQDPEDIAWLPLPSFQNSLFGKVTNWIFDQASAVWKTEGDRSPEIPYWPQILLSSLDLTNKAGES